MNLNESAEHYELNLWIDGVRNRNLKNMEDGLDLKKNLTVNIPRSPIILLLREVQVILQVDAVQNHINLDIRTWIKIKLKRHRNSSNMQALSETRAYKLMLIPLDIWTSFGHKRKI